MSRESKPHELKLDVPFVWPDPRVLQGPATYWSLSPIEHACVAVDGIFGLVQDLSAEAIGWLGNLSEEPTFQARLVLGLYPACATTRDHLIELLELQNRTRDRVQIRLYVPARSVGPIANVAWFRPRDRSPGFIVIGSAENFGFFSRAATDVNLAFRPDPRLLHSLCNNLEYLWALSAPLTQSNLDIPELEPAPGDPEAARLWEAFAARCTPGVEDPADVTVDPQTGDVQTTSDPGEPDAVGPGGELRPPRLTTLERELAALYEKGTLVTIEKTSRIPPLEVPVKAEWFGIDSFRQAGSLRRSTTLKVSPFEEATLRTLNAARGKPAELLPRFSFALADAHRWMPVAARPLFEAGLSQATAAWERLLKDAVPGGLDSYLESQRERILRDARDISRDWNPEYRVADSTVDHVLKEIRKRLGRALSEPLVPGLTHAPVKYDPRGQGSYASPWGQAYRLLLEIALFPRRYFTERFFLQGLSVDENEFLVAMNVFDDHLVSRPPARGAAVIAKTERDLILRLEDVSADAQKRCEALFHLIRRADTTHIEKLLMDPKD